MSIRVNDFRWEPGKNDREYIKLLEESRDEWERIAQKAISKLKTLSKAQEPPTNASISSAIECLLHPQDADDSDMAKAIDMAVRAMRLLKEQEPVSPIPTNGHTGSPIWICGNCKSWIGNKTVSYCWHCGRAVKWE